MAPHRRLAPILLFLAVCGVGAASHAAAGPAPSGIRAFPPSLESYGDAELTSVPAILAGRIRAEPFNLLASTIFLCAIIHTFFANSFTRLGDLQEKKHRQTVAGAGAGTLGTYPPGREPVSFAATILHFLGEVEAVFGIWAAVLLGTICLWFDWEHVTRYVATINYAEPVFVVVIMCIAGTRPVVKAAERGTSLVSRVGGGTPSAWWLAIFFLLPPLGSFITEPAAMTVAALLLSEKIFALEPSRRFKYATLGLLFVDISVGGMLTHFAAPPVLMVASAWNLDSSTLLQHFGWKALVGIAISNILFFVLLRHEFSALASGAQIAERAHIQVPPEEPVPWWVTIVHLLFVVFTVLALHSPPLVIMGLLFFLAFTEATRHHQYELNIRSPLLVGLFLAALVTHGGFQQWWIQPVLSSLGQLQLFVGSIVLTAFNDNAAITYLASLVPAFDSVHAGAGGAASPLQYAVLTGAVTGGGLTIIANAPNPAGQAILAKHFRGGVSPAGLLAGALLPTALLAGCFWLLQGV